MKKRNLNLDLIRCVAVFSVIAVHFFLNSDFYNQPLVGKRMFFAVIARTAFMVCVPLFLLLTGYLMNTKKLTRKYYKGILHTLCIYFFASTIVYFFQVFYLKMDMQSKDILFYLFDVGSIGYSWYVEMYIGLFLLIPFINLIWNGLDSQKEHKVLIISFLFCTTIPSIFSIFDFFGDRTVFPNWWIYLYPFTYYFIGAYIKTYGIPFFTFKKSFVAFIGMVLLFGSINFYKFQGGVFLRPDYQDWFGFENVIDSVLLFLMLLNIKTECLPQFIKNMIAKISSWSFAMYLLSYIFDNLFYPELNALIPEMRLRLPTIVIIVPLVFVCSAISSWLINKILYLMTSLYCKISTHIKNSHSPE